ncbi:MAG: hypothetical protein IJW39_03335 [Opitutales bacterium]|nr:hypothetical protein [Opitutales bacterium]
MQEREIELETQPRNFWKGASLGLGSFAGVMIWLCVILHGNASANKNAYRKLEQVTRKVSLGYIAARVNEQPSSFDEAVKRFVVHGEARDNGTRILAPEDAISGIILNPLPPESHCSHEFTLPCGESKKRLSDACASANLFFLFRPFCDCNSGEHKGDSQTGTGDSVHSGEETDDTRHKESNRDTYAIQDRNTTEQQSLGI